MNLENLLFKFFIFDKDQYDRLFYIKEKLMKTSVIFILSILITQCSIAQTIEWERSFGGSDYESAEHILITSDNNYLITGRTLSVDGDVSENFGEQDIWLLKLDQNGELIWEKSIGGGLNDRGVRSIEINDGGFLVFSSSTSSEINGVASYGLSDAWIHKIDHSGEIAWSKNYGGSEYDRIRSARYINENNIIVIGSSRSDDGDLEGVEGDDNYWIFKIDDQGNLHWSKTWVDDRFGYLRDIALTADGGFITLGSYQEQFDLDELSVTKHASDGTIEWEKIFVGNMNDMPASILQTNDGDYMVCAHSNSTEGDVIDNLGDRDFWLLKLDQTGAIIWNHVYGGSGVDVPQDLIELADGNFMMSGYSSSTDFDVTSNNGASDKWIVKLSAQGELIWEQNFGGSDWDISNQVLEVAPYQYISVGRTRSDDGDVSSNNGSDDIWITKFFETPNAIVELPSTILSVFPNPSKGDVTLSFDKALFDTPYQLVNALGQVVQAGTITGKNHRFENIPKGMYCFALNGRSGMETKVLMVQ